MKTEVYTDPKEFMKALKGGRSAKHSREARPDIPRAGRAGKGEGDRQDDLNTLALHGYTCTHCDGVSHWMTGAAGKTTPAPSYRAMIETGLELVKRHSDHPPNPRGIS